MTILKLGKDSPESGEHPRYPESMSGVPRTDFLTNFHTKIGTYRLVRRVGMTLENGIIGCVEKLYMPNMSGHP